MLGFLDLWISVVYQFLEDSCLVSLNHRLSSIFSFWNFIYTYVRPSRQAYMSINFSFMFSHLLILFFASL